MTELSFLLDLLLNHKLLTNTKKSVVERIQFIEGQMSVQQPIKTKPVSIATPLEPVTVQAQQAVAERNIAIQAAVAGKPIEVATGGGSRGPRKF